MANAIRMAVVALALAACGDDGQNSGWTASVDTLPGGTIRVVNTPPSTGAGPTWVLQEELRIGAVDGPGPMTFGQLKALAVDDAGRIAVLDAQPREVRIFGPDGAHLATYGGRGSGPGELQNPLGIMQTRDGLLYVPDQQNARMTVFSPTDGFVQSYPLVLYRWGFVWDGAMRDDDHVLVWSMVFDTRRDLLRIYAPDMTQVDSVLLPELPPASQTDPGAYAWEAPGGTPRGFAPVPFYSRELRFLDRSGDVWSSFGGDPAYRIVRWSPGGDTTLMIETRREPVPVTAAERDSALNAILGGLRNYGVRSLDASRVPDFKPGVLALFADDEGRLWVRTTSPASRTVYDIYESDGRYAGSVSTSLAIVPFIPPVVRGGRFHAVVTDELDIPYVVRARLSEPSQGGS